VQYFVPVPTLMSTLCLVILVDQQLNDQA
jgi:hypothetical protein